MQTHKDLRTFSMPWIRRFAAQRAGESPSAARDRTVLPGVPFYGGGGRWYLVLEPYLSKGGALTIRTVIAFGLSWGLCVTSALAQDSDKCRTGIQVWGQIVE